MMKFGIHKNLHIFDSGREKQDVAGVRGEAAPRANTQLNPRGNHNQTAQDASN
jgi:hypothetical protein